MKSHILGFPRIGSRRELKFAVEAYWRGESAETELLEKTAAIKQHNWQVQKQAGLDYVTVGNFSLYDHVLDLSCMAGGMQTCCGSAAPAP